MTAETMDFEKPDNSITLPNTAPSRNTGKYSFKNPTIFSIKTPVKIGGTAAGSVKSTASMAAMGANRMTLNPRYATNIKRTRAATAMKGPSAFSWLAFIAQRDIDQAISINKRPYRSSSWPIRLQLANDVLLLCDDLVENVADRQERR